MKTSTSVCRWLAAAMLIACTIAPAHAVFLSADPVEVREEGDNFNRYAYAHNNPYTVKDPDGRDGIRFYTQPHLRMATPTVTQAEAAFISDAATAIAIDFAFGGPSGEGMAIFTGLRAGRVANKADNAAGGVTSQPLLGRNPRNGGSRTNTDLGPGGNRASAKAIFRNQAEGQTLTEKMDKGGFRTTAENGVQIRHNPDGSSRVELPGRGPRKNGESIHTPPPKTEK